MPKNYCHSSVFLPIIQFVPLLIVQRYKEKLPRENKSHEGVYEYYDPLIGLVEIILRRHSA